MSFLTEAAARRVATLTTTVPRTLATSTIPRAAFSSGVTLQKSATETAKDTLKTVDRAVSDKLVDGINIGSTVASKAKEVVEDVSGKKTTGATAELRGEAAGKTSEVAGKAKGTASEVAGRAEGTAEKVKGKVEGAAEQAKRSL
ncbi:hypothetical protein QBC47DRAFT_387831 [Echria macrotheca]|uniref:Uncharacterized protein n=1 Tax=Echria macrotheca TaxID=438768 RepID=A0AAJ0B9B4_9PEZI|nr:hypothetical protein QBC47DRAFT_387831 [Echria macrotheca]